MLVIETPKPILSYNRFMPNICWILNYYIWVVTVYFLWHFKFVLSKCSKCFRHSSALNLDVVHNSEIVLDVDKSTYNLLFQYDSKSQILHEFSSQILELLPQIAWIQKVTAANSQTIPLHIRWLKIWISASTSNPKPSFDHW